jgi:hypothetical protein
VHCANLPESALAFSVGYHLTLLGLLKLTTGHVRPIDPSWCSGFPEVARPW